MRRRPTAATLLGAYCSSYESYPAWGMNRPRRSSTRLRRFALGMWDNVLLRGTDEPRQQVGKVVDDRDGARAEQGRGGTVAAPEPDRRRPCRHGFHHVVLGVADVEDRSAGTGDEGAQHVALRRGTAGD